MLVYAGQGKPALSTLDLNQLVQELTPLLGPSISKKARVQLDLQPGPLLLDGDPSQVQQILMNLVINASEALADRAGGITIRTRLETLAQGAIDALPGGQGLRPGLHVLLEVADTGGGMSPEVLKRVFDPFFSTKFTGRGLGLAAVHGIVRGHRGAIQVSSEPGVGSLFQVLFPASAK